MALSIENIAISTLRDKVFIKKGPFTADAAGPLE
jgi:hypothetical protein